MHSLSTQYTHYTQVVGNIAREIGLWQKQSSLWFQAVTAQVQYTLYSLYTVLTVLTMHHTLHTTHYTLYNHIHHTHCTLYSLYSLYTIPTIITIHCTHHTLHTAHCTHHTLYFLYALPRPSCRVTFSSTDQGRRSISTTASAGGMTSPVR
jgi:hypothetical protein